MKTSPKRRKLILQVASVVATMTSTVICLIGVGASSQTIEPAAPGKVQQVSINPYWGMALSISAFGLIMAITWWLDISKRLRAAKRT